MAVTFTRNSMSITVTPVNGTLKLGGGSDDRGGGKIPNVRAGIAKNGSFQVVVSDVTDTNKQHTISELKNLVSPVGSGDFEIEGNADGTSFVSHDALVDVEINGDAVQTATISWKGTYADEEANND